MKRHYSNNRSWLHKGCLATIFAAAGLLFAACNDDPASEAQGRPLPEGAYPLSLTAAVVPAARATADDAWRGGEQVAVEASSGNATAVKTYTAAADGPLSAADADDRFWWSSTDEQKTLRAWYCGDGSSAADGTNGAAVPTEWSTAADQSEADSYHASDLLFAPAVKASFGNAPVPLRFYHQTAKVVVQIKNAEYVTDAAQIRSVRIGAENLALMGSYEAPTNAGATAGVWTPGATDAEIIPRRLVTAPEGYVASYEALVIPQSMDGERLVAVETAVGTMYFTPKTGDAQLAAGKVHIYIITVKADRLEVEVVRGGSWNDGGSEGVESYVSYSASDLKIGDYYYSDGTWSDGGLRGIYADGSLKMAEVKPAPENDKTVIGIVFQTDPARIGAGEKKALADKGIDTPHGLVVATKAPKEACRWFSNDRTHVRNEVEVGIPNILVLNDYAATFALADADIEGYKYNMIMRTHAKRQDDYAKGYYPAFKAAADFEGEVAAPATTTGWYLPSNGQWFDILRGVGGAVLNATESFVEWGNNANFQWTDRGDVPGALNAAMAAVLPEQKTAFKSNTLYWSSSASAIHTARAVIFIPNGVYCAWNGKDCEFNVRPVLAF